jgi:hypothetical protein
MGGPDRQVSEGQAVSIEEGLSNISDNSGRPAAPGFASGIPYCFMIASRANSASVAGIPTSTPRHLFLRRLGLLGSFNIWQRVSGGGCCANLDAEIVKDEQSNGR